MIHTIQGDIRIEELEIVVKVVLLLIEEGDEGVHGEEGRGEAVLAGNNFFSHAYTVA